MSRYSFNQREITVFNLKFLKFVSYNFPVLKMCKKCENMKEIFMQFPVWVTRCGILTNQIAISRLYFTFEAINLPLTVNQVRFYNTIQ